MHSEKVYIFPVLTETNYNKIAKTGEKSSIIYLKKDPGFFIKLPVINLSFLDQKGFWNGWRILENEINSINNFPQQFEINFKYSVKKYLYNSYYKDKGLVETYRSYLENQGFKVVEIWSTKYSIAKYLRKRISLSEKFFKIIFPKQPSKSITKIHQNKILIPVNVPAQVHFWSAVIRCFEKEKILFLIDKCELPKNKEVELCDLLEKENFNFISIFLDEYKHHFSIKDLLSLLFKTVALKGSLSANLIDLKIILAKYILYSKNWIGLLKQLKPSIVLVNAFEINNISHIFCQIARQSGSKVINAMNGLKTSDPRNCETNFDVWCVWSETQKNLLVETNFIPKEQLKITGHLQADKILRFKPNNKLIKKIQIPKNKKIISIFSQPKVYSGDYREKFFQSIKHFFSSNKNVFGIIKPHPREDYWELQKIFEDNKNLKVLDINLHDKSYLYDLLDISNLAVVMYSTVAVEALYFKKPVISLDYTGIDGILPLVDEKTVFKCSDYSSFESTVKNILDVSQSLVDSDIISNAGFIDGKNYLRVANIIKGEAQEKDIIPL